MHNCVCYFEFHSRIINIFSRTYTGSNRTHVVALSFTDRNYFEYRDISELYIAE